MKISSWFNWRLILLFVVLGPLFGAIPVLFNVAVKWEASNGLLVIFLVFLAWAYVFGVVPAALTALFLSLLTSLLPTSYRYRTWLQLLTAVATGFAVTLALFIMLFDPLTAVKLAEHGAFSALICTIVGQLLRVVPNNSFKPTPLRGAA